jgi:ubiquinone/menaquinone biosynthesis C-methylase UbiE
MPTVVSSKPLSVAGGALIENKAAESKEMLGVMERTDLGEVSDVAATAKLFFVSGLELVDVGCGAAAVSRELVQQGAQVIGFEPDPIQAEKNRKAEAVPGLTLREGRAENLPLPDDSVDGVLFFRSLHHVPIEGMDLALREAVRVLKPETGFLCVVEPGMTGSHFEIMRPFHDETKVRTEAQAALMRLSSAALFRHEAHCRYVQYPHHASFEDMVTRVTGQTFNAITRDKVETEEVRALFERGKTRQGDYVFEQPMLLDCYRGLA